MRRYACTQGTLPLLAFQALKLQLDADIFRQYVRESVRRVNDPCFPAGGRSHFLSCREPAPSLSTGRAGFSPVSCFQSCRHRSLISAFWQPGKRFPQKPGIFRLAQNAGNARFRPICRTCAAASFLETGSYQGAPDYLCRYAEHYYDLLARRARFLFFRSVISCICAKAPGTYHSARRFCVYSSISCRRSSSTMVSPAFSFTVRRTLPYTISPSYA